MLIIIKPKIFQLCIRIWNTRPLADKTWDNFKDSFRSAYDALHDLGDLTLDQPPILNQAQLMESIMYAMKLSSQQVEESPADAAEAPTIHPPQ